jgi:hypothetical protein
MINIKKTYLKQTDFNAFVLYIEDELTPLVVIGDIYETFKHVDHKPLFETLALLFLIGYQEITDKHVLNIVRSYEKSPQANEKQRINPDNCNHDLSVLKPFIESLK